MSAFTPEQEVILNATEQRLIDFIHTVHQVLKQPFTRLFALQKLMIDKGLVTAKEIEDTIKWIEAGTELELTFNPEYQVLQEELKRLRRQQDPGRNE